MTGRIDEHLADVMRYDGDADGAVVGHIVRHLGIAMRSPITAHVTCADRAELKRIKKGWCRKKLGVDGAEADAALGRVCVAMSDDRNRSRVTFYYLLAKELGRLDRLGSVQGDDGKEAF